MAVAFRSLSSKVYGNVNAGIPTTLSAPAGIVDGDILLLAYVHGQTTTALTITPPTGFTVIQGPSIVTAGGFTGTRILAWKLAASESGSYGVLCDVTGNTSAVLFCVSGANNITPVSSNNSGTGVTTTALSVTTPAADSYVAFFAHNWGLYDGTSSPPTGDTERLDISGMLWYASDAILAGAAAATGNKTHGNRNAVGDPWAAFLVSVGPSGGGGPTGNPRPYYNQLMT